VKKSKTTRKPEAKAQLVTPEIQARFQKVIDRIANPRPEPIEFPQWQPSIADRIGKITTLVTLIAAASTYDNDDLSEADVLEAIRDAANKAVSELYWLGSAQMPASIGNLPSITDDEYREAGVDPSQADERDDFFRARMREMLDGVR
jgi:hypothetical protein